MAGPEFDLGGGGVDFVNGEGLVGLKIIESVYAGSIS